MVYFPKACALIVNLKKLWWSISPKVCVQRVHLRCRPGPHISPPGNIVSVYKLSTASSFTNRLCLFRFTCCLKPWLSPTVLSCFYLLTVPNLDIHPPNIIVDSQHVEGLDFHPQHILVSIYKQRKALTCIHSTCFVSIYKLPKAWTSRR